MPGHKRNPAFFPSGLFEFDLTEIPNMDVLSSPTGIINKFQEKIKFFYDSHYSFFMVNGSSAGVMAAICYSSSITDSIVLPRNAHVSAYNGLAFSGITPQYIMPKITADGLAGGVCAEELNNIPHGAAVLIISPTYEGFVSDISAISQKVHEKNGILIVDEAHGAHFKFHKSFPKTALEMGADIVINSFHKTLPALSQTAVLHVRGDRVDVERLKFFINAFQTSSPSYVFMAQVDYMLNKLWNFPGLFDEYVNKLTKLRNALTVKNKAITLCGTNIIGTNAIYDTDISKILLKLNTKKSAHVIEETLASKYKIQLEMANGQHLLALTSVADTDNGFNMLQCAIEDLNKNLIKTNVSKQEIVPFYQPQIMLSPQEALRLPSKKMPWEKAAGKISAQIVTEYPPGIAIIAPGEVILEEVAIYFSKNNKKMSDILVVDK